MRDLDGLNTYLNAYNSENNPETKVRIKKYLREKQFWHPAGDRAKNTLYFLENIAKASGDFVSSLEST